MKDKYWISIDGCDDSTSFEIELTEGERQKVLKTLREQYGIEESKVKSISRRL